MSEAEFYAYRKISIEGDEQIPFSQITQSILDVWIEIYKKQPLVVKQQNKLNYDRSIARYEFEKISY